MARYSAVVTNQGISLMREVIAGKQPVLDYATLGDGTVPAESLMLQQEISGEKHRAEILECKNLGDAAQRVHILIYNQGLETGFRIRQVGIWAHILGDDGAPVLIAIIQDSQQDAQYVPGAAEIAEFTLDFYAAIAFHWTGTFSVQTDPSTLVTVRALQEAMGYASGGIRLRMLFMVTPGAWQAMETKNGMSFRARIMEDDITVDDVPKVVLSESCLKEASRCGISTTAETQDGYVELHAAKKPETEISGTLYLMVENHWSGTGGAVGGGGTDIPVASETTLGGIKASDSLKVDPDGTAHAVAEISDDNFAADEEVSAMIEDIFGKTP